MNSRPTSRGAVFQRSIVQSSALRLVTGTLRFERPSPYKIDASSSRLSFLSVSAKVAIRFAVNHDGPRRAVVHSPLPALCSRGATVFQFARVCALGAVLLAQAAGTSQPPPPPPSQSPQQPPPRFRTETNLVRVDVYATKDGVPVQDLTAADFEVSEDNAPQKIDTFEHIVVRTGGPQEERSEPNSVSAANELAADPRRRVFVVYLDIEHVDVSGSHNIKEPLIDLLTRIMGPDDLVGVMTPTMSPSQITFGRRTQVIEEGLRKNWAWGRRDTIILDEREKLYADCFPPTNDGETRIPSQLAKQMIERRRERIVLDSLQDLIRHMGAIREGRTAVITVSDGWKLYQPDPSMTTIRKDRPGAERRSDSRAPPPVGVGPGGGLTTRVNNNGGFGPSDRTECEKDQMDLAMADNELRFRDLFGEANRANVSFYPIDPRGLPVFDTPIGPEPPLPPVADHAQLVARNESLHTLAINTDGIALAEQQRLEGADPAHRGRPDVVLPARGTTRRTASSTGSSGTSRCARSVRASRCARAGATAPRPPPKSRRRAPRRTRWCRRPRPR